MKIRIKRRKQNEAITFYVFIVPFLFAMLTELLHLPSLLKYTVDIAWMFLLLTMLTRKTPSVSREANRMRLWILVFFLYCALNSLVHYQSVLYILWGFRNTFRFYIFFLACVYYLNRESVEDLFVFINKIYYIHVAVVFIQFFVLGYSQDNLGGIFGTKSGCNGWLNAFDVIVVAYSLLRYLHKECTFGNCILNCGTALGIAALAELKFFYAEFIVILLLAILLTDFTWKKVGIIVCAMFGLALSVQLLLIIFPSWADSMSVQGFMAIAASDKGYTSSGDMNRLTFMGMSNRLYLVTPFQQLFGLGLGNCDYSDALSFLTTPFYKQNGWTHYTWLSSAHMYLENGLAGFLLYFGFFIVSFITSLRYAKELQSDRTYIILAQIVSIMCIAISIYNASLRMESGYMLYFILAVPYVLIKEGTQT